MARLTSPFVKWLTERGVTGKGFHQDLFTAACFLREEGWTGEEGFQILRAAADISGRNRALFRMALLGIHLELEGWEPDPEIARLLHDFIYGTKHGET